MRFVDRLAEAIARYEGYFSWASRARRNRNPGNLRRWAGVPVEGGYAVFATHAEGWGALRAQCVRNIDRGLTLAEFFGGKAGVYPGYAPAADGNRPRAYAETVARRLGVAADRPLLDIQREADGEPAKPSSE